MSRFGNSETARKSVRQTEYYDLFHFVITVHGGLKTAAVISALVILPVPTLILSCDCIDYQIDLLGLLLITSLSIKA